MAIALDSKDLALVDKKQVAESQVWEVLKFYGSSQDLTEADFVGVNEVRVNKISGYTASKDYKRNASNANDVVNVDKETRKLKHERYKGFTFDMLDQDENAGYTIQNVLMGYNSEVAIPEKDTAAFNELYVAATTGGKVVDEDLTVTNILESYDTAEAYFASNGLPFRPIMFMRASVYKLLKNADKISRGLRLDDATRVQGIDRSVRTMDNLVPIIIVEDARMVTADEATHPVNFMLVNTDVSNPISKYNDMELVPSSNDANGFRDTAKLLAYYDNIVLDNKQKGIYVSRKATV